MYAKQKKIIGGVMQGFWWWVFRALITILEFGKSLYFIHNKPSVYIYNVYTDIHSKYPKWAKSNNNKHNANGLKY